MATNIMTSSIMVLFLSFPVINCYVIGNKKPEQIHIAFGDDPCRSMSVTWSTEDASSGTKVQYGEGELTEEAEGVRRSFQDGGEEKRVQYVHRVLLTHLKPATRYVYRCGSSTGWSDEYSFRTANSSEGWSPRVAVYGDMGTTNARILPFIQREVSRHHLDSIIHIGDFAYDIHDDGGRVGDEYMRMIESVAANVPYMVCPGNHEHAYNFSHFRERFTMPGNTESLYYSFNLGPVHFISIDTEAYYYLNYGETVLINQYNWLVKDLKEANEVENRKKHPWVIVYGHKPMYCSNLWISDCALKSTLTRVGLPKDKRYEYGLEELGYDNGVDLLFWGDEHSYERHWPIYNYRVKNGSYQDPYTNPGGPIHITTGAAGSKNFLNPFTTKKPEWSALRLMEYGYTMLEIKNHTHLHIQQISVNQDAIPLDDIWIVKDHHGSYGNI